MSVLLMIRLGCWADDLTNVQILSVTYEVRLSSPIQARLMWT